MSPRAVYDAEEEAEAAFLESLGTRIRGHERDIERMCNKNYQGFIESVSELLKVKSDALKLRVSRGVLVPLESARSVRPVIARTLPPILYTVYVLVWNCRAMVLQ